MVKRASLITFLSCTLCITGAAQAEPGFTLESVKGSWGFTTPGSIGGVPVSAVGRSVFDGAGACNTKLTLNFGGTLVPLTTKDPGGQCSYTVDRDGLGAVDIRFVDPDGNLSDFLVSFVIIDERKEYRFITSDAQGQTVGYGVSKRQRRRR